MYQKKVYKVYPTPTAANTLYIYPLTSMMQFLHLLPSPSYSDDCRPRRPTIEYDEMT